MTLAQLVLLAIKASIVLIVFALGLKTRLEEATHLFRHPGLFIRSIVAMNVIMPAVVVLAAMQIELLSPIRIALIALAVSPVPPVLPIKEAKAGGTTAYAIGLLVGAALMSVIIVPVTIELIGRVFDRDVHIGFDRILPIVLLSVIAPLALGIILRSLWPNFAERIAKPVAVGAAVLLVLAAVPMLVTAWPLIRSMLGQGVIIVLILFALVGLIVGHALGGPDPDDRTVLALSTAIRHPGIALAIVTLNFPGEKAAPAVVMLHLIIGAIASVPYAAWRKRVHAAHAVP